MIDTNFFSKYMVNMSDIKPKILEALISVYGENNRNIIINRLDNIYINTIIEHNEFIDFIKSEINYKLKDLTLEFISDLNYDKNVLLSGEFINQYGKDDISCFKTLTGEFSQIKKRCDLLNKLGYNVTVDDYFNNNYGNVIIELENIYLKYDNLISQIRSFVDSKSSELEYIESISKFETKVMDNCKLKYYEALLPILGISEKARVEKVINEYKTGVAPLFDVFPLDPKYKKIATDFIYENSGTFSINNNYISSLDFKIDINKKEIFVPNIDGNNNCVSVINFRPFSINKEYRDVAFIFELCKAIELNLEVGDKLLFKTGFSEIMYNKNYQFESISGVDNFSLNIDQVIAMGVTSYMHKAGISIFDSNRVCGSKLIEVNNILNKGFFKVFRSDIVNCRLHGNCNNFFAKVGSSNILEFRKLNNKFISNVSQCESLLDIGANLVSNMVKNNKLSNGVAKVLKKDAI